MDGITASVIGSSTIDGSGLVSKNRRTRKRSDDDNRRVEHATFNVPQ